MADARQEEGDPELLRLFERFKGQLVSPGGAAALLGLSRKTIYTLGERGELKVFRSRDTASGGDGPAWAYIPLADVGRYAEKVGRPFPRL